AKITGVSWQQSSGPAKTKIASPGSLSTGISGLTAAGAYQFRITVTDQNGKQAAAVVNVTVKPAPAVANTPPPAVSAGKGQTIAQPASQVTLQGTATGTGGATITALTWKQGSGPVTARISSPTSLSTVVSGMTKTGSYIFTLTATDSKGKQASGSMTVVINAATATPPVAAKPVTPAASPTVNAGGNQTIALPASSVGLKGTATGGNGTKITGVVWQQSQGPAKVKFASTSSLSTSVTGLTAAGGYVFRLTVTDQNGKQAAAVTTVMVNPAPAVTNSPAPTVSAGQGQRISLPATQATLTGKATGNGGATIKALTWKQSSGPVAAKIGSPASISTAVSGMTAAGNYVFTLTATDSKGESANGSVTVTIASGSAATTPSTKEPPAVSAGGNQTITLPTNSVTLTGSASGRNGAVVDSYFWRLISGPGCGSFGNELAPATTVGGLVAGTYVFEFEASDNNTETGTATVTVVVNPKPAKTVTGNSAVIGDAAMTDPSAADSINGVSGLVIYPNPVHDLLNLNIRNDMKGRIVVAIFGMNGSRLQTQELTKESWNLQSSVDV